MPRPSAGKRTSGAGTRDNKHDNGLVGPAKRTSSKKHGQADGPATAVNGVGQAGPSAPAPQAATPPKQINYGEPVFEDRRRSSIGTYSEVSSDSSTSNMNGVENHRSIDVNATKNADVHRDSGPLELATSVLKSLPTQDTLAMLIILMYLPPIMVSGIFGVFTLLTFAPPVTSSSGMSLDFANIFDGNSNLPSSATIFCLDAFFILIWLFLWQPIQDIILDFAKPVIAITLGGGTDTRSGTSRGIKTGFTWVILHHLVRGTRGHWSRLVRYIPEEWRVSPYLSTTLDMEPVSYDKRSPYAWVKSVLAIHILTQGVMRYVREWYLRREKSTTAVGISDPEAGKQDGEGFHTPDVEGFQPSIVHQTARRKRKHSAQVRLQQPLWAALASTKIVMMKEYEVQHAAAEFAGANATDIHDLGHSPFNKQPKQIWISYIGSDEVCFNTSFFPNIKGDVEPQRPFFVRVNHAYWQPTRMFQVQDEDEQELADASRWTGDIYGLRPASQYVCEFVDVQTQKVIFSTSIRTVNEPLREEGSGAPAIDGEQSLRPDSPATTLKTSIAAAETKLADEKNKLKTLRKEWKTRINALRKDNETTDNQLASSGSSDEKFKQKIRQQETQKAQAERDTDQLADQLKTFDTAPELGDRKKKAEKAFSSAKTVYDAAAKEFKSFKSKLAKEVKDREVENANLNTRRNKIATRIAKVENELANITDANNRGIDEAERRKQERAIWEENVASIEANYLERIAEAGSQMVAKHERIHTLQTQLNSMVEYMNPSGINFDGTSDMPMQFASPPVSTSTWNPNPTAAPHFPTGLWTGSSTDLMQSSTPPRASWPTAPAFEPRMGKQRGRSSSMLSDVSGFTQSSNEMAPSPAQHWTGRLAANGSSGSSSVGDPTSPIS